MNGAFFLERLARQSFFSDQIAHVRELSRREARYAELGGGIDRTLREALESRGIERLYAHQADSIEKVRQGKNVVVVTGTASGKTLCYAVPVLEAILEDPRATVLLIYPTKALAQDQLRGLEGFGAEGSGICFTAGTYDGDTPQNLRRRIRDGANIVLTNPDMLHQGILPHHARWNRFFSHLRFVVIDEVHAYRGVFGSHLANVMRRLSRICRHYDSQPQFICSSATISNPKSHAELVCGASMELVSEDGSPRGPKRFVLWNPPPLSTGGKAENWHVGGDRRSPVGEAVELMTSLVKEKIQTITFVRTRLSAELIFRYCRDRLGGISRRLAGSIHAYRGGYLPEERREIERKLAEGEILGVSSTNALELGIDIGSLDACVLVGYPGSIASLWQQSGRAGRGEEESVVFLVAQNSPIDQFLVAHPDYLFSKNPESAVVDPDNPHVIVGHLKCASNELPLKAEETALFGEYAETVLELLEEDQIVRRIDGSWYWASSEYPAAGVSLRNIAGPVYTIQDGTSGIIGTMDEMSAMSQLHDHAVYLHGADTYFVDHLDLEKKVAFVEKRDLDYYTRSVQASEIRIDERETETAWREGLLGFGDVTVTTSIPMFKKVRFHSRESIGFEELALPPQLLETVALWFAPPAELQRSLKEQGLLIGEALVGIANVLVEVAPLFVMCDPRDIGAVVDSRNLGRETLFLHDRYPGGMGYARRCLDRFDSLMRTVADVVSGCGCENGCPSCVGSATPAFAMTDLDSSVRGRIAGKAAARRLLEALLGRSSHGE